MTEHVSDAEIEEFALGELPAARLSSFEAHVSRCDDCAARLAREARLELQLAEVHSTAPAPAVHRGLVSRRNAAALATLALAATVLVLVLRRPHEQPAAAIPNIVCPDGADQRDCVRRAQRRGLFVQYPGWADSPPFGDNDRRAGPSVAPYPTESRVSQ
jgi:anti-sigma factor RsiW